VQDNRNIFFGNIYMKNFRTNKNNGRAVASGKKWGNMEEFFSNAPSYQLGAHYHPVFLNLRNVNYTLPMDQVNPP